MHGALSHLEVVQACTFRIAGPVDGEDEDDDEDDYDDADAEDDDVREGRGN